MTTKSGRTKKRDLVKYEVPSPAHYEAENTDTKSSQIKENKPERMTFTELANELTRRSNLDA